TYLRPITAYSVLSWTTTTVGRKTLMRALHSALTQQSFFSWYAIRPQKGLVRKMTATKIAASYPRTSKDEDHAFRVESLLVGDRERRLIKERTLRGKKQKIDQGIWLGIGRTK